MSEENGVQNSGLIDALRVAAAKVATLHLAGQDVGQAVREMASVLREMK